MSADPPPPYSASPAPSGGGGGATAESSIVVMESTARATTGEATDGATTVKTSADTGKMTPPPPSYTDAICTEKLPSYDEVQRGLPDSQTDIPRPPATGAVGGMMSSGGGEVRIWPLPALIDHDEQLNSEQQQLTDGQLLGTDLAFLSAFLVAFLFNWIGFLALLCFCQSVAARYGALAGFGLSLAKWTLIVKNNTRLVSHDNLWLWWLIMAFGLVICVRAVLQYFYIKREWRSLSDQTRRRLVLFY